MEHGSEAAHRGETDGTAGITDGALVPRGQRRERRTNLALNRPATQSSTSPWS